MAIFAVAPEVKPVTVSPVIHALLAEMNNLVLLVLSSARTVDVAPDDDPVRTSSFIKEPNVEFNATYSERKVITYGDNFFAFEHGDVTKKLTPLVYATEFPKQWGATIFRTCYTGHFHTKKVTEFVTDNEVHGFAIKHLPSLGKSDYWHYHNKFTGSKRQAIMEIHDVLKGKISEFVYTV